MEPRDSSLFRHPDSASLQGSSRTMRHHFLVRDCAMNLIRRFLADETGATAIEYGLIAAGIALAIITVVNGLGTNLRNRFTSINNSLR
jgi:pilus assembly protein Flp/PilA